MINHPRVLGVVRLSVDKDETTLAFAELERDIIVERTPTV